MSGFCVICMCDGRGRVQHIGKCWIFIVILGGLLSCPTLSGVCVKCFGIEKHNHAYCKLKVCYSHNDKLCYICGLPANLADTVQFHKPYQFGKNCDSGGRDLMIPLSWSIWRRRSFPAFQSLLDRVHCNAQKDDEFKTWITQCESKVTESILIKTRDSRMLHY